MIKERKCLEIYLDSRQNGSEEILQKIKETKEEFPNKEMDTYISLNDFGMYIIKIDFRNKDNYWNKLKERRKKRKTILLEESTPNEKQKKYGKYKETKIYKPY